MTYKNLALGFACILMLVGMNSCQYPEGPILSLASATNRIAQQWEIIAATDSAGENIMDRYDEAEFDFEDDRDAEATLEIAGIPLDYEGTWDLDNDQTIFELDLAQKTTKLPFKRSYEILRLTRSEFWLLDMDRGEELRLELK